MNRFRIAIAATGVVAVIGLVAPSAAFADGSGHGGRNGGGGNNSGTTTTTTSGISGSNMSGDRDGDGDNDHPVTPGAAGNTGAQAVADHSDPHGDQGRRADGDLLRAVLAPSAPTDASIFGVTPGGLPWSLNRGSVRVSANGRVDVEVRGLVVSSTGANPVPDIAASVYCNGVLSATTLPAALSPNGNGVIKSTVTLPATCMVPAVLLHPASSALASGVLLSTYIAFDGAAA